MNFNLYIIISKGHSHCQELQRGSFGSESWGLGDQGMDWRTDQNDGSSSSLLSSLAVHAHLFFLRPLTIHISASMLFPATPPNSSFLPY